MDTSDFLLWAIRRIWRVVCWCWFTVFHLALAVGLLAWWWAHGTTPRQIQAWCLALIHGSAWSVLSFLGMGASAIGLLYAKLWQLAFQRVIHWLDRR